MSTFSKPQHPYQPSLEQELQQTIVHALQQADTLLGSGQNKAAEDLYRGILEIQPEHPMANHRLGVLLVQSQQPIEGLPYLRTAVAANHECEQYWLSYVNTLIQAEQIDNARQALELGRQHGLHGDDVEELAKRLSERQQEKTSPVEVPHAKAVQAPSRQDIKRLASLHRKGRPSAIEAFARDLTERFPTHGLGWKTLGVIQNRLGRVNEALQSMQKAVNFLQDDSEVHNDLGTLFYKKGLFTETELHLKKALELKPNFVAALSNMGNLLRAQRRFIESEATFLRAIKLEESALLYNNLGATLLETDRIVEAESCFRRAIRITPGFALALTNLGVCLRKQGRLTEAIDYQRRAIKLDPQNTELYSNFLFTLNYTSDTASFFLEEARRYNNLLKSKIKKPFSSWQCSAKPKRLRVGLLSGDLHNHPVGFFLESILGSFDANRVEIIVYPTSPTTDELTARIKKLVGAWKPLVGIGDEAAARIIHDDGVHVLLDLSGHTSHNRLPMLAWKPAPVQASWLGYFATTGVPEIDYFLADQMGVPESHRENFTEELWYLPDTRLCFSAPEVDLPVASLPALVNKHITFGCFQLLTKVGDEVLKVWSSILNALPEARLRWQCRQFGDPEIVTQLVGRLQKFGIDTERVSFLSSMPRVQYLAAHAEVDLILDTFPFPGGTTTCEALWMGVPTLTLAGNSLLSRQGASLLTAAGLSDWVATSKTDYIEKAITMASDLNLLADLRAGLRAQVLSSPLFDAKKFARNLEEALWGMWQKKQPQAGLIAPMENDNREKVTTNEEKPVMNFFNPVFWGTSNPERFTDLMRQAAELTTAYHFGDNMFLFQRNNSMLNDQIFMKSWESNAITPPDRTIIWRRYILTMAGFHCQHLEGDFVECGAYQGVGAKTVIDYLGGKDFPKTFWLYDLFEHNEKMVNHSMQAHGPQLYSQVVNRFKEYPNVKIFKGFLPEILEQGCPEKIAYLHLDLNQAPAEIATLDALFDRVVPGGMIILDDYEMVFYRAQKLAEDTWFEKRGYKVFPLPTSQGFVIKR
jgi:predicted O-linked N-acetylglucosamine transferase (SPINDLY family)